MPDSHAAPTTIATINGAATAWKRKTAGKVAAIARAGANPLRRVPRLSAITPAKSQTRHASGIQTNKARKYMNVGGKVPTPGGFPERATLFRTRKAPNADVCFWPLSDLIRPAPRLCETVSVGYAGCI
jgi:hypothetical protein